MQRFCAPFLALAALRLLFAGKMTLHDAIKLEPFFDNGYLVPPLYLPPWVQQASGMVEPPRMAAE